MLHRVTLVSRLFRAHAEHGYERKSALNKHVLLPALHTELQHQQHNLNCFQTEPRRNTCEEPAREVADARLSQRWGCDAATCPALLHGTHNDSRGSSQHSPLLFYAEAERYLCIKRSLFKTLPTDKLARPWKNNRDDATH